ncbi:MAG TPA: DUF1194 domain-containing protein [Mesorhizobium sp.]|jgi:hypothetical protein|nr:DUF1194 domain-containing protein [Mesorhizobium sp.]
MRQVLRTAIAALALASAGTAQAQEPVDVELVLAVDVSLSMSHDELEIQRRGYAEALTDPTVLEAIQSGAHGRIAVTYFEWAGNTSHRVIVPWRIMADEADAREIASQLSANLPTGARRTSISGALEFAGDLLAESGFQGMKRVIDVSGDGPNNQGAPVEGVRDALVEQGVTINGLPLMTRGGYGSVFDVTELDKYYADCVIGGPAAFMIPVNDWPQFPEAVRRKLVLELADAPPTEEKLPVVLAQAEPQTDCLIGEKIWRDRYRRWDLQ